jgi:hypothetical protein
MCVNGVMFSIFLNLYFSLSMDSTDALLTSATVPPHLLPSLVCHHFQTQDGTCYGHDLKEKYFLLDSNYTNLNHGHYSLIPFTLFELSLGSFGTIPKPVAQRQFQYVAEVKSRPYSCQNLTL